MSGSFNLKAKTQVGNNDGSFYITTVFEVPFTGEFDRQAIWNALYPRVKSTFVSLGNIAKSRDGFFTYEHIYHRGD